jgi:c-di-GMP-binding flagellar brake protein YcgR
LDNEFGTSDLDRYRIYSRREILALLRSIKDHNQLVSLMIGSGNEAVVTSILHIDDANNYLVVDSAPSHAVNERILASGKVAFETNLEQIRILFTSDDVRFVNFENLPAFRVPIPESVVRLQRREFYRVATPVANPVRCIVPVKDEEGHVTPVTTTLYNISAGGVALVDDRKILDNTPGFIHNNCRIDLPGGAPIAVSLQVRNSTDLTLTSGRSIRRIGCMFVNLPQSQLTAVQRYITKLERERNARLTGMT